MINFLIANLLISTPTYLMTVCIKALAAGIHMNKKRQSKELLALQWLPIIK